ncbi:MAG: YitT family protein [Clostridia bacterium]|nr:YitT family protein [Clostridia bacterium]
MIAKLNLTQEKIKDFILLTFGTLCISIGVYFFKFPNNFSTGGVSGISVVLNQYIPNMSAGSLVFVINAALLLIGFLVFGKGFGLRTAYSSTLFSGAVWALERLAPMSAPMTSQPFMELIFAVALPAVGSAILFNIDASSGGTDIVAMLLRKYTSLDIGKSLMISDCLITVAACFAFGMETGLFSIMGLLIKSLLVDMVLENIKIAKCFHIITANPQPIQDYIVRELHRGATVLHGEGAFTHEDREVLLTVVSRAQAVHLRRFAKSVDPHSFILITSTSEIIGKGFRGTN